MPKRTFQLTIDKKVLEHYNGFYLVNQLYQKIALNLGKNSLPSWVNITGSEGTPSWYVERFLMEEKSPGKLTISAQVVSK